MSSAAAAAASPSAGDKRVRSLQGLGPALEAAKHQAKKKRTSHDELIAALRAELALREALSTAQQTSRKLELQVEQETTHDRLQRVEHQVQRLLGKEMVDDEAEEGEEEDGESSEPDHASDEESDEDDVEFLAQRAMEASDSDEEEESKSAPSTPVKADKPPPVAPGAPRKPSLKRV